MRATILLGLALLTGCATPLPYAPKEDLVARDGPQKAAQRLTKLLERVREPRIGRVKVDSEALEFRPYYPGQAVGIRRIVWEYVGRVDVYANYRAFVYDRLNRELFWAQFNYPEEAQEFADLVMSFRAHAAGLKSGR